MVMLNNQKVSWYLKPHDFHDLNPLFTTGSPTAEMSNGDTSLGFNSQRLAGT